MLERDALLAEIIELATACQTGSATDDERARLERLLEDSEDARQLYLRFADETVTLNDVRQARQTPSAASEKTTAARSFRYDPASAPRRSLTVAAVAAALAGLAAWSWFAWPGADSADGLNAASGFARIVNLTDVQWSAGAAPHSGWDRLGANQSLQFDSGNLEILYDNGVQLLAQGPAYCELISGNRVLAHSGKYVARVGPEAIGFEIVTPHAQVVDLGTSFGMTVQPGRQTDIVVYEGMVDFAPAGDEKTQRRLEAGEALRVDQNGATSRIASVADGVFLPPPRVAAAEPAEGPVIRAVTDNLAASQTAKYYRVISRGFREDCQAYVDRPHQWNGVTADGIPPFLNHADYVMTFNDDKVQHELRIAVELAQPARLYLFVDDRVATPKWLSDAFEDTGWDIGLDEGYDAAEKEKTAVGSGRSIDQTCSVWSREVKEPSTVLLGALQQQQTSSAPMELMQAMYGIAATPLAASAPPQR